MPAIMPDRYAAVNICPDAIDETFGPELWRWAAALAHELRKLDHDAADLCASEVESLAIALRITKARSTEEHLDRSGAFEPEWLLSPA